MRIAQTPFVGLAAVVLLMSNAAAHDLLLDPSHDHLDARAVVSMRLFLGHQGEGQAVKPSTKGSQTCVCVTPDGKRHVPGAEGAGLGLLDATQTGVYVFGYATRPALLHVEARDLLEVVREAGEEETHGKTLQKNRIVRPWRVEERHHAKSVVVIEGGKAGKHDTVLKLGLELFLDRRPDRIAPAKPVQVKLLQAGLPLAAARVVAFPRNAPTKEIVVHTDAKGQAAVTFPTAGSWALRCVRLSRAPRQSAAEWIASRATLTFEIPQPAAKPSTKPKPSSTKSPSKDG